MTCQNSEIYVCDYAEKYLADRPIYSICKCHEIDEQKLNCKLPRFWDFACYMGFRHLKKYIFGQYPYSLTACLSPREFRNLSTNLEVTLELKSVCINSAKRSLELDWSRTLFPSINLGFIILLDPQCIARMSVCLKIYIHCKIFL